MENYCKPTKPTPSELLLRKILKSRKIPINYNRVIFYTSRDCFTPDLIIGKNLIIEVDGKVHDKEHVTKSEYYRIPFVKNCTESQLFSLESDLLVLNKAVQSFMHLIGKEVLNIQ